MIFSYFLRVQVVFLAPLRSPLPYQPSFSTHPSQHFLSTHPLNPPSQHILSIPTSFSRSTHPIETNNNNPLTRVTNNTTPTTDSRLENDNTGGVGLTNSRSFQRSIMDLSRLNVQDTGYPMDSRLMISGCGGDMLLAGRGQLLAEGEHRTDVYGNRTHRRHSFQDTSSNQISKSPAIPISSFLVQTVGGTNSTVTGVQQSGLGSGQGGGSGLVHNNANIRCSPVNSYDPPSSSSTLLQTTNSSSNAYGDCHGSYTNHTNQNIHGGGSGGGSGGGQGGFDGGDDMDMLDDLDGDEEGEEEGDDSDMMFEVTPLHWMAKYIPPPNIPPPPP